MRLVIFGSRWIDDIRALKNALKACGMASQVTEVVSGGARGVDRLGERYARQRSLPCKLFPAQWAQYGKSAGPLRNAEMARYADFGVAIWDGVSKGTAHMIRLMEGRVFVWQFARS
jgi:hypothetical protein